MWLGPAISQAAFEAIARTLPGSVSFENKNNGRGERYVWARARRGRAAASFARAGRELQRRHFAGCGGGVRAASIRVTVMPLQRAFAAVFARALRSSGDMRAAAALPAMLAISRLRSGLNASARRSAARRPQIERASARIMVSRSCCLWSMEATLLTSRVR